MKSAFSLTPQQLLAEFDEGRKDVALKALQKFSKLDRKVQLTFLEPAIEFLKTREEDGVRSWGVAVLEQIGGKKAFRFLVDMLKNAKDDEKQTYRFTRFFALKAVVHLAASDDERNEAITLIEKISNDKHEQGLIWAASLILLARERRGEAEERLRGLLSGHKDRARAGFWGTLAALRALREFPFTRVTDDIILVIRDSEYLDLKNHAIKALGFPDYKDDLKVIHALGEVVIPNPPKYEGYLRLEAVKSLGKLGNREARADLVRSLEDEDAEIRFQASVALYALFKEAAAPIIVQRTLEAAGQNEDELPTYLIEALRRIDRDRTVSTAVLSNELGGEDRKRAQLAEKILLELGGWAAVQRLSQRRTTLESLDKLLAESEKVVKSTFEDTIRQARLNFYFAMGVNLLVVFVGLVMVGLSINQLIQQPEKLETWIIPGGAGVLGVLINLTFNNPRRNAREDLTALMNVNVIFLGFLRQLNEIDATFKHAYIESRDFGTDEMRETVEQIERAMQKTLNMAARHLRVLQPSGEAANVEKSPPSQTPKDENEPAS